MAKTKRKVTAANTRGKATLRSSSVPDDLDHVRSIVLAVQAPSAGPSGSSSTVLHSVHPPLACAVGPAFLPPIPEDPPVPKPLQTATVDDGSEDENDGLVEALSAEEQLDFSFSDDDGEDLSASPSLLPPAAGLTPSYASEGRSPPSSVVAGGYVPPTIGVAGSSLASSPGSKIWSDLFSASKQPVPCTKLQHFSLNHLTNPPPAGNPLPAAGNGSVFHRLGPQIPPSGMPGHSQPLSAQGPSKASQASCDDASDGWIAVAPRKKFRKHIRSPPKGKEALAVADVSALSPNNAAPPNYAGVANSIDTEAVVEAGMDLGVQSVPCHQPRALDVQADTGSVFSRLGPQPPPQPSPPLQKLQDRVKPVTQAVGSTAANVPSNDWVTVVSRSKSSKQAKGKAIAASPCAEVANG
ncbi:hypothetical protein Peur_058617 [Populus x canadensis]